MEAVGAALSRGVELSTGRVAKLRAELILNNREVLDRVVGDIHDRTRHALVVVVDALDGKVVIARTLSADCRARAGSQTAELPTPAPAATG